MIVKTKPAAAAARRASHPSRVEFAQGDRIEFAAGRGGAIVRGTISRLNPKRAVVAAEDGRGFHVPYRLMTVVERAAGRRDAAAMRAIQDYAKAHLAENGLAEWEFHFDNAKRRGGLCDYARKTISVALQFAQAAPMEEIKDTVLHEIAHAVTGPGHGHDDVWRRKALALGCSAQRCHSVHFSEPRYIAFCAHGCLAIPAERRRRNCVCRRCRAPVTYEMFTPERWRKRRELIRRIAARDSIKTAAARRRCDGGDDPIKRRRRVV